MLIKLQYLNKVKVQIFKFTSDFQYKKKFIKIRKLLKILKINC